ncbi:MAG: UDP-N-acetylglucosamine--N-acetylmuramyl-(pentapeptide) pyrophosphoryl-undecaprenol N-acetylglucosamine transferase [Oscillospiraceae bacterium]|jgi:UDP-N-acetylglucosamine--N-acetylmuramyl-(pentapeptide) pyrophosphoryl-undecaprenol N-acetylglucosamine transferase|nr:UDP-N-acetylglucosamine--N-acetylmuramyl-(pentapeptide) pyrophosphoryl-undecaprenol N-acetylglucosamine transferase [Oscillospiraceae bacterium]
MNVLIVCAGTAGHINPAIAVAEGLRELDPKCNILFVGAGRPLENRLIPEAGFEVRNISMSGLRRSLSPKGLLFNLRAAGKLLRSFGESRRLIAEFSPDYIFGTGGYVCYPVLREGQKARIPTGVHESNSVAGLAVKALSGRVTNLLTAFSETLPQFKNPAAEVLQTPVRSRFYDLTRQSARELLGIPEKSRLVVSFWGSLGSSVMNEITKDFDLLAAQRREFTHIHGAGSETAAGLIADGAAKACGGSVPPNVIIKPYLEDAGVYLAAADLFIGRAGGSTIAELCALRLPSILVPSPHVTGGQQIKNAEGLEKDGAAVVLPEAGLTGAALYEKTARLLEDTEKLDQMRESLKKKAPGRPALEIAVRIMEAVQNKKARA